MWYWFGLDSPAILEKFCDLLTLWEQAFKPDGFCYLMEGI